MLTLHPPPSCRSSLFPVHFKSLYPGHKKLDDYIFGGGGGGGDTAALKQASSPPTPACQPSQLHTSSNAPALLRPRLTSNANQQIGNSSTVIPTAALRANLAPGLKGPGGMNF